MGKSVQNVFRILIILRICAQLKTTVIFRTGKLQRPQAFIGIKTALDTLLYYSLSSLETMHFRKRMHYG